MILDIGCGSVPKGHVNIDLFVGETPHHGGLINPKLIPNFIRADAHYLPFQDKIFHKVNASQLLEHIHSPFYAVKEMDRVCYGKVRIATPSQFCLKVSKNHIYTWNPSTLKNLLELVFDKVEVEYNPFMEALLAGRLGKYVPILNLLSSKIGFHSQLTAVCENFS